MTPVAPEMLFCDLAEEGAATGLLALMTGISEEFYCASWLMGLEHSLWQAATAGPMRFGMGTITQRQCDLLRLLSEEADGWWTYGKEGAKFMRLEAWKAEAESRDY